MDDMNKVEVANVINYSGIRSATGGSIGLLLDDCEFLMASY